jgi:DNA-binding XRE family transcriptional regulator
MANCKKKFAFLRYILAIFGVDKPTAKPRFISEKGLAALAKRFRQRAGVSKAEAARRLHVNRGTMQQAEEYPEVSLTKLRIRIIEKYSPFTVAGPVFLLNRK